MAIKFINDHEVRTSIRVYTALQCCGSGLSIATGGSQEYNEIYLTDVEVVDVLAALEALKRDGDFRSFRPQRKYRPLTPIEAAAQLGQKIYLKDSISVVHEIESVSCDRVRTTLGCDIFFTNLAVEWAWLDTANPCGIEVKE